MESIAKTSLLTALMRDIETQRGAEALFSDPFASKLADLNEFKFLKEAKLEFGENPAIALRTAFIDQKIISAQKYDINQIVFLAAGMDTRAYRLDFISGTKIFELDQASVIQYKTKKLKYLKPHCELFSIECNLKENWPSLLLQNQFNPQSKTLWIIEGLLMYLDDQEINEFFRKFNTISKKGDELICDIMSEDLLKAPSMQRQLNYLKELGAPWKFGVNEPELFFEKLGWRAVATQPGEFNPNRWPFPVAPRFVQGVPRSFYIHAEKI